MKQPVYLFFVLCFGFGAVLRAATYTFPPPKPYADKAGAVSTTAVHKDDSSLIAWATGYQDLSYGAGVSDDWKTPSRALGEAQGTSSDILCLGRGGQVTLTFQNPIVDGAGADFAVFENSFSDTFRVGMGGGVQ